MNALVVRCTALALSILPRRRSPLAHMSSRRGASLGGKESQFVTFNVVLGTFWCANEVMHVHDGQPSLNRSWY
jgi:hypothetical protein